MRCSHNELKISMCKFSKILYKLNLYFIVLGTNLKNQKKSNVTT